jgi:hypothetical protein
MSREDEVLVAADRCPACNHPVDQQVMALWAPCAACGTPMMRDTVGAPWREWDPEEDGDPDP